MRRVIAAGVLVAALAGGCSSRSHHVSSPSTTAPVNPDVVPAVITPAYVDSVFVALNHVAGNAARALRASHQITPEIRADVRSIYNDPVYPNQLRAAQQSLAQGVVENIRPNGGDPVTVVTRLISATTSCVFVEARTNYSAEEIRVLPGAAVEYYELRPKQVGSDPKGLNVTPWAIALDDALTAPRTITSTCHGS